MALKVYNYFIKTLYFIILIAVIGCGEKMAQPISSESLKTKLNEVSNNSSESWWYAGSDGNSHYIAIKRPLTSEIYKVNASDVSIIDISSSEFTRNTSSWVNLKVQNIEFTSANK